MNRANKTHKIVSIFMAGTFLASSLNTGWATAGEISQLRPLAVREKKEEKDSHIRVSRRSALLAGLGLLVADSGDTEELKQFILRVKRLSSEQISKKPQLVKEIVSRIEGLPPKEQEQLLYILLQQYRGREEDLLPINQAFVQILLDILDDIQKKTEFLSDKDFKETQEKIRGAMFDPHMSYGANSNFQIGPQIIIGGGVHHTLAHEIGHNILNHKYYFALTKEEKALHELFAELIAGAYDGHYSYTSSDEDSWAGRQLKTIEETLKNRNIPINHLGLAKTALREILEGVPPEGVVAAILREAIEPRPEFNWSLWGTVGVSGLLVGTGAYGLLRLRARRMANATAAAFKTSKEILSAI